MSPGDKKKVRYIITHKSCIDCDEMLPLSAFSPSPVGLTKTIAYCKPCSSKRSAASNKKANDASLPRATRNGYPWTGPEIEIIAREDLSISQMVAMLNRTRGAVKMALHHHRHGTWKNHRDKTMMKEPGGY